jgi:hypothetical protein
MTRRKSGKATPRAESLYALRVLAVDLEDGTLTDEARAHLVSLLHRLGAGEDPIAVLGLKAARGEDTDPNERRRLEQRAFTLPFITKLMAPPEEDGAGMTKDQAFNTAAQRLASLEMSGAPVEEDDARATPAERARRAKAFEWQLKRWEHLVEEKEEWLRRSYADNKDLRGPIFSPPYSSHPIRRPKKGPPE